MDVQRYRDKPALAAVSCDDSVYASRRPRRASWRSCLTAALLCLGAAQVHAQLDSILQQFGGRNANELRRAAREAQAAAKRAERDNERSRHEQGCREVAAWLAKPDGIPSEVLARRFGGARAATSDASSIPYESWLLEDSRFVPMFGKPYDAIGAEEGAELQQLRSCPPPRNAAGQATIDNMFFHRIFHPSYQARYIQGVQAIRAAHQKVDGALMELSTLGADDNGLRRLEDLRQQSPRLAAFLGGERRSAYEQALVAADQRIAQPLQGQRVREAVAQARGYEGLQALVQLHGEIAGKSARGGAANPALAELRTKQAELAREQVAHERARIDALGSGPVGLERGVHWYREYQTRYASLADTAPDLRDMMQYFEQRRTTVLDTSQGEISARIRQARSNAELEQLVAQYLPLEMDRRSRSGTVMLTQVAQWRDELHKRSVLGSQAAAPPLAPARPVGAVPGADTVRPVASGSSAGEPTASEMYDLLRAKFDGVAAEVRELSESCKGGFPQNDPGKAMLCMAGGVAGMSGAREPMKITRFEKLGCERASGKPGYVCDYLLATSGGAQAGLGPSMAAIAGRGGAGQARFLRTSDGWIAFFGER